MNEVNIGEGLDLDMTLWRYMSIDKFIDLISTKTLFLAPLSFYQKSDPFEGCIPKVAYDATNEIFYKSVEELEVVSEQLEDLLNKNIKSGKLTPQKSHYDQLDELNKKIKEHRDSIVPIGQKIYRSTCVSCWYHSEVESEVMWKLYSDGGKGVAIRTTVRSLTDSINSRKQEWHTSLGRVKYLDFLSTDITPRECVIDGVASPLLKRKEYEHENEIRLYSVPVFDDHRKWEEYRAEPILVDFDAQQMIESVYISPYVSEPFDSGIKTLCSIFDISDHKVIKSELLTEYEKVLGGFNHSET